MKVQKLRPALAFAASLGLLGGLLAGTAQANPPGPLTVPPPPVPADAYTIPPLPAFGPIDQHSRQIMKGLDIYIGHHKLTSLPPLPPIRTDRFDSNANDFLVPPLYSTAGKAKLTDRQSCFESMGGGLQKENCGKAQLTDQQSCFPAECCSKSAAVKTAKTSADDAPCCFLRASTPQSPTVKLRLDALSCCPLSAGAEVQPDPCHPMMAGFDCGPVPIRIQQQPAPADSERRQLLQALLTMVAENSQLKAQAEFAARQERMFEAILEAREESAKLKGQLERMAAQQEMMEAVLQSREEVAKLKAQIELLGHQQEFFTGMVQMQIETEKAKLENAHLKARLSQLERPQRPTVTVLPAPEATTIKPNKSQRLRIQAIVPSSYVPVPTPDDDCDETEESQPD